GWTAAQVAAAAGHVTVLEILVDHGQNLNDKDGNTNSLLQYAEANNQLAVTEWLLKKGVQRPPFTSYSLHLILATCMSLARCFCLRPVVVWVVRTIGVSLVNWTRRRVDSMKHLKLKTQEERELRRLQQLTGSTLPQQLQTETEQSPLIPKQQDLELGQVGQQKEGELQKKQREELKRQNEQGKQNKKKIRLPSPHRKVPHGLPNLGNTCYMNSVLQCLYHSQPLTQHILSKSPNMLKGKVLSSYDTLVRALSSGKDLHKAVKKLKTTVGSLDDLFQDYEQKEAHDFMSMMIQWLHDDMVQIQGAGGEGETGVSLVSKLFHGTHTSTITCPKKEEIICQVSEPFSNLTLAVNKSGCCDLQDLLQKYYREQQIDWECNQCLKEHKCHHSTSLQHLPSILVIHLSRFNKDKPYGKKTEVTFPANRLSLSQFTHSAEDKYVVPMYNNNDNSYPCILIFDLYVFNNNNKVTLVC
ncbi:hypothetical protein OTU49_015003, partial [Cherax quadricarinatus]